MSSSLLSLSTATATPSTTTPLLHLSSSHFKGNIRTLKENPFVFPSIKLSHSKPKQRQPLVVLNLAASGVQETEYGWWNKSKRKGRGHAAGQGGSCGFGMRGQKSRSGPGVRKGFEGGQMPLYRRIPKLRGIAGGIVLL